MKQKHIKRIALLLCAALFLLSSGCGKNTAAEQSASQETLVLTADNEYVLQADSVETALNGNGAEIAFAADSAGMDAPQNAIVWQGVQNFASQFNYTAKSYETKEDSETPALDALRAAATGGANIVVCAGAEMAVALYEIEENYPGVNYLILDAEPHSEDYTSFKASDSVHCVLFEEQEAGYLAGYAAVTEGKTQLCYVAANEMPDMVRYGTGFLQGVQAAAEQQGVEVNLKFWYVGLSKTEEEFTNRIRDLYNSGVETIFVAGGNLIEGCITAAKELDKTVIAADVDQDQLDSSVLFSATKNYSTLTQKRLYDFFADGQSSWSEDLRAATEQNGYSTNAVGLTAKAFDEKFTQNDYTVLYQRLRNGDWNVSRISDMRQLPETENVTTEILN